MIDIRSSINLNHCEGILVVRVIQFYLNQFVIVLALSFILPSVALGDFFNYARYLQLEVVPEVQVIKDADRYSHNPSQSSIRALNKLLALRKRANDQADNLSQVRAQASLYLASL